MRVKGSHTTCIEVDVDAASACRSLKAEVFTRAKINRFNVYIHNGKICTDEEMHGSHSWFEHLVVVAEPTEQQLKLVEGFNAIEELLALTPRK